MVTTAEAIKTSSNKNGWMQTYSGRAFFPADPDPREIDILDISHSLSQQCRFAGHCTVFYSVAEHCCHVSDAASDEHKLTALMHDASEAYLIDIPRPVKPLLVGYYELEDKIMKVIAEKYCFAWPLPQEVKNLDTAILADEREQNLAHMDGDPVLWGTPLPPLGVKLKFWSPARSHFEFMLRLKRYMR